MGGPVKIADNQLRAVERIERIEHVEDEIRGLNEVPRPGYYCLGEGYLEVRLHVTVHPARRR